jgi:hypothetical protein
MSTGTPELETPGLNLGGLGIFRTMFARRGYSALLEFLSRRA